MSIYKVKNGYKLDFRANATRAGEKAFRTTRTFKTKTEALHAQKELNKRLALARAKGRGLADPRITLGEAIREWWSECEELTPPPPGQKNKSGIARTTDHRETSRKNAWLKHELAECRLFDLTTYQLENWITERRDEDKSESTIRSDLSLLNNFFKYARIKWRWQIDNPTTEALSGVGHSSKRDRRLDKNELNALLNLFDQIVEKQKRSHTEPEANPFYRITIKCPGGGVFDVEPHASLLHIKAAFLCAIESAMRRGKMFEIQWSWIDFSNFKEPDFVIPNQCQGPKNKPIPSRIPISPTLRKTLLELRGPARIGAALDEPIFGALLPDRAYRLLKMACDALNIEDFRWHDLRHEACSRLSERGWTIQQIQSVSGHKTLQALERYIHVSTSAIHEKWREENEATGT